jgi:hypothetical protein
MKKIVILTMLLAFAIASFGQQDTASKPVPMQTDYLKKSKRQKTAAWIMLGAGLTIFAGILIFQGAMNGSFGGEGVSHDVAVIAGAGLIVAAGSIPFFIVSSKNKKKAHAASVFIDMEKAQVLQGTAFNNRSFPALGVQIHL